MFILMFKPESSLKIMFPPTCLANDFTSFIPNDLELFSSVIFPFPLSAISSISSLSVSIKFTFSEGDSMFS